MNETPDELPEAVGGVDGESDVVAERSGADTPRHRRPLLADMPRPQEDPEPDPDPAPDAEPDPEPERPPEDKDENEREEVVRPDAGPTG
ncbi:hypothetical protein [Nonomuraea sp. NPDC050643]|uniref:hypothetical protein n=1 Tax=Nonomuraea sp. NPDC050643 TaxID=3155660 RepID=UPI0033C1B251